MGKIVGIDLGTTNSVIAIMEGGQPKVLVNEEGSRTTPSVVAYLKDGSRLVGLPAKRQAVTNPENTIYSSKRFIGRRFSEVQEEIKLVPYKVIEKGNDVVFSVLDGKLQVSPEEVGAAVLSKLKKVAEDYLGQPVKEAVITVPAYFNDSQRQATKDAGRIAGLEVKRIINEPTAAALAYGLDKKKEEKIAVYDFGGGTFDISILEVGDGVIEVKSTNGDTHLGGDNFDERILQWMVSEFKKETGIDLKQDKMALQRLKDAAEKAKIELSSSQETEINLPFITADSSGPKHLQMKLTRSRFEQMIEDLVERSFDCVKRALDDAGLKPSQIDEVILVGGSTRVPLIQRKVKEFFGKEPNRSVNPDEVVAVGAAIQGAILTGEVKDILLLDVTPLSLGVETLGGVMTVLIPRNTTIPVKKSQIFTTAVDNQTAVEVHVLQGERKMAADNKSLGRFELVGIPPAPRGVPQIEVTFDIDANGILHVSAKDLATGKSQQIRITAQSGLTEEEIQRAINEAERYREEDERKQQLAQARNELDLLIYSVEKNLKDVQNLSEAEKQKIQEAVEKARKVYSDSNASVDSLKAAYNELMAASHELASKAYAQKSQDNPSQPSQEGQNQNGKSGPDVIDADFKDVH